MLELIIIPDGKDSEMYHAYKEEWVRGRKVSTYHIFSIHADMLGQNSGYVDAMHGRGKVARFVLTPKVV